MRGAGGGPRQLLPGTEAAGRACATANAGASAPCRGAPGGARPPARTSLRRPVAGGDLCHAARREPLSVLGAHAVPGAGRIAGSAGAPRSSASSALRRAAVVGDTAERAVELGHHEAAGPDQVDLLL